MEINLAEITLQHLICRFFHRNATNMYTPIRKTTMPHQPSASHCPMVLPLKLLIRPRARKFSFHS